MSRSTFATEKVIENVSRRGFLKTAFGAGAFIVASRVLPETAFAQDPAVRTRASAAPLNPSVYLGIEPDGTVFLVTHRSEMGTGIRTSLPLVAADELEADWTRCRIEQGVGDKQYGDQNTDGSRSVRDFFDAFRRAGAAARTMLISAAATQWNVPASECFASNHEIVHRTSNRRLGFGALVPAAAKLPVPDAATLQFKPKSAWKFIGKETSVFDLTDITVGKASFGLDIYRDGMVFASVEHPPVVGGVIKTLDDKDALKVKGVQKTVKINPPTLPRVFQSLGGVAVIADSTWAAFQGRKKLKVEWNDGPNASFESEAYRKELIKTVSQPAKVVRDLGDVDKEFAKGGKILEATYTTPMLAHAAMEPPAAVADFRDGKVTVWAPTQNPQAVQETVGAAVGIDPKNVTCHVTLLGGGFGRKSKPDYVAEAAILSKQLGKPVKVIWTREDDIKCDFYHATAAVYHKASLDSNGRPTAWLHRSAFQPIASTIVDADTKYPLGFELDLGLVDLPFDVPNIRAENGPAAANVRIGWFRAVTNNFHVFASGSFADEMAAVAGRDPLEYLLEMLGPGKIIDLKAQKVDYSNYGAPIDKYPVDSRRLRRVLEVAGEMSGWAKRKSAGKLMGISAHRSFNTYVASVVQVEIDSRGDFKVPRIDQVVDAGIIINPDRVRSQMEGAAVMAVGMARTGEISALAGRIKQGNFNDFKVARMGDAPVQVNVHLMDSNDPPSGCGEPGVPPVIAALGNALFAATGKRTRDLPLTKKV